MISVSTPEKSPGELRLDPGPQARRRSSINWKCVALSIVTLGSLLGLFLVFKVFKLAMMPQDEGMLAKLYQDSAVPFTPQEVVRPLINSTQTFDVIATVWLRQDILKIRVYEGGPILSEKAIYSDTIFRGLRLEDKSVATALELKIPTEIFKSPDIWIYDLRASFVLVPDSPSPLDFAVNYSSWIPTEINHPPMRSWPAGYSLSLADRIVDSYGTSLPLLVLNTVNSSCPSISENKTKDFSDEINNYSDEIFDLDIPTQQKKGRRHRSTKKVPVLEAHPHIITRSHLRVVDMTQIFNRTEYEKQHRELRDISCGQIVDGLLDWRFCVKNYKANQHGETRIKLRKKNLVTGENTTEWAYAPYMSLSNIAWGPLDLVKVPVNREKCQNTTSENSSDSKIQNLDEDFINITWKVSFSGTTPGNMLLDEKMGSTASSFTGKSSESNTDEEKKLAQSSVEFMSGLTGHRTEGAHPRRQLALTVMYVVISLLEALLDMHYWFSRVSTVGISIRGSLMISSASLLSSAVSTVANIRKSSSRSGFAWIFQILMARLPGALMPLFMLKAALRMELKWYARWIPALRIASPTHSERASQRLDARISWMYEVMALAALAFIFTYYPDLRFLSSGSAGTVGGTERVSNLSTKLHTLLISPSIFLGRALQLIFNYRAKRFARMYRLGAPMLLIAILLAMGNALPHVVGHVYDAKGVSVVIILNLAYAGVLTWQSVWYAPVASQEEDESSK